MQIDEQNVREVMSRFYDFGDGVVVSVDLTFGRPPPRCVVVLDCMDRERQGGWVRLRLDIREVREFRFEMGRTHFDVMSSGIQFGWRNGLIYVVLDAYPDDGDDLPNLATNIAYAAGKSCDLAVSDEPPG